MATNGNKWSSYVESLSTLYRRRSLQAWQYGEESEEEGPGREQERRVEQGAAWPGDGRLLESTQVPQSLPEDESLAHLVQSVTQIGYITRFFVKK